MKFIGHLDVMRYFQKAFRRAEVEIAYSKGYSPHQMLSFAAPLGIGITSEGEYLDAEFDHVDTSIEMIERMNAVMLDELHIEEFKELPEDAENAMASVAAADYQISIREGHYIGHPFWEHLSEFFEEEQIVIWKKTKKSEKEVDIRPMILELYQEGEQIFMRLATGSVANLKPETVMEALCNYCAIPVEPFGIQIHRLETYLQEKESGQYIPLGAIGKNILVGV